MLNFVQFHIIGAEVCVLSKFGIITQQYSSVNYILAFNQKKKKFSQQKRYTLNFTQLPTIEAKICLTQQLPEKRREQQSTLLSDINQSIINTTLYQDSTNYKISRNSAHQFTKIVSHAGTGTFQKQSNNVQDILKRVNLSKT